MVIFTNNFWFMHLLMLEKIDMTASELIKKILSWTFIIKGIHKVVLIRNVKGIVVGKITVPLSLIGSSYYMINNY